MSSDESSDYGGRRKRTTAKRGRKGKRGTYRDDFDDSPNGGPAKVKLKVKTGGTNITGKKGVKGGYTITNVSGKDANVPPQWQGFADRELDSDTEEPLVFEEAFILRMPVPTNEDQVKELERFSDMVKKREPMDEKDVWFKFLDSRRAVFNLGKTMYNAKLVDLPCLIESQKTHDNKHVFKTADISQMLLVEYPIASEQAAVSSDKPFNIDDYIYPHGLSPPLRNVRRRRFKPRINKQAIEIVERQVERLIEQDEDADEVKYEMVDESEIQEGEQLRTQAEYMAEFAGVDMSLDPALMAGASTSTAIPPAPTVSDIPPATITEIGAEGETPVAGPSEVQTPAAGTDADGEGDETGDGEEDEDDEEEEEEEEEDSDAEGYDSDLAAMIEGEIGDTSGKAGGTTSTSQTGISNGANATQQQKQADKSDESEGSDESDEDDLFGKGRSDDEDDNVVLGDATVQDNDETLEAKRRIRLMADEMKDLENAVSRKKGEVSRAPNPIIKRRFEDSLKKLTQELEMKKAQHVAAQNKLQHFQNEIKKADAAEKEAAAGPPPPTAEETAAAAAAVASGSSRSDPATVFGDKKKTTEKINTDSRSREDSEDIMQVDRQSPPPLPPPAPQQSTQSNDISTQDIDISVIQEEPEPQNDDGNDDIQVSMQDISVGDTSANLDDLFGDDPDE